MTLLRLPWRVDLKGRMGFEEGNGGHRGGPTQIYYMKESQGGNPHRE